MEMTERKLKILQAIISDYVKTAEPIGSRTLSKRLDMNVSPATIRNEMSDLEEMGYLTHPHTSAGRVPSDKAYRLYVNQLMEKHELSAHDKRDIANELQANVKEFERTIEHAARILSRITNLTSFAVTPTRDAQVLKFVNLIPVDDNTIVMMIVSENGEVTNNAVRLKAPCSDENLKLLAKSMTYTYRGRTITEVLRNNMIESIRTNVDAMCKLADDIMPDFIKTLEEMLNVHLYMDGLTNIFDIPEYSDIQSAKTFLSMLDRKEELIRTIIDRGDGTIVTIGSENDVEDMSNYSMITATYSIDGKMVGKIGVIGPKRMKYGEVTSIMEYLTENLNNSFMIESGGDEIDE